ncbi:MAG: adenosylcobinamide-phosphate synthase CbiB [Alcanivoracaceae bacterium]|nr:adenosylcobinamide-phosphate synthase CbiB [Alcanivoracaceae bacterium]
MSFLSVAGVCVLAVLLDAVLGEPRRAHPLVGFGRAAQWLELHLNAGVTRGGIARGAFAMGVLVTPPTLLAWWLSCALSSELLFFVQVMGLWLALALRSLSEHGQAVARPLIAGDLARAREQVARIVSRDTQSLDHQGVAKAATESMLENGADAVFASLFWFVLAGLPGVVLHRTVNTLDAMWGYRTERFEKFGKAVARVDDLLNWCPARLTALTYCLCGHSRNAWQCWRSQARQCESPNAGPVMAAGAGALRVTLGGGAPYHGGWKERPVLGMGDEASGASIVGAITLVRRGVLLWLVSLSLSGILFYAMF